jgi:PKD repeat protein
MNTKRLYKFLLILFFVSGILSASHSQKNDYVWLLGMSSRNDVGLGYQWGTMIADFKEEVVLFEYDSLVTMDFTGTNISHSDKEGNLIMYSNGMGINGSDHNTIKGVDTIAYGSFWENYNLKNYFPDGSDWALGLRINQGILILSSPDNRYFLVYYPKHEFIYINGTEILETSGLLEAKIEIDINGFPGNVLYKDKIIQNGTFKRNLTAVRHGNGRDWWVIQEDLDHKGFYMYILDENGIKPSHFCDLPKNQELKVYGQSGSFSPDGQYYVTTEVEINTVSAMYVTVYSFDRCSGTFVKIIEHFNLPTETFGSAIYSPDGNFFYVSHGNFIHQYSMDTDNIFLSGRMIAEYDGSIFKYTENDTPTRLRFSKMTMGPDGKIYIEAPGNARSMHTIEYPDEYGEDATVIQNSIKLETQNFNSLPSFPNFRMGPLDGSPCDTLGLNNMPVAKFRYAQDTSDHLNLRFTDASYFRPETWFWDFGDGQTFEGKKPYWHKYEQSGTYTVCLTVSNENGSDTSCKVIHVGTVSSQDPTNYRDLLTIFPNPVENDLMVRVDGIVPSDMYFEVYNLLGQLVHRQKVYFGLNQYSVSSLAQGSYVYRFVEKNQVLQQGKVVKM